VATLQVYCRLALFVGGTPAHLLFYHIIRFTCFRTRSFPMTIQNGQDTVGACTEYYRSGDSGTQSFCQSISYVKRAPVQTKSIKRLRGSKVQRLRTDLSNLLTLNTERLNAERLIYRVVFRGIIAFIGRILYFDLFLLQPGCLILIYLLCCLFRNFPHKFRRSYNWNIHYHSNIQ
jgi:hypothetical protein